MIKLVVGELMVRINVEPMAAPRLTRADSWKVHSTRVEHQPRKRLIQRYHDYRDALRGAMGSKQLPDTYLSVFYIPMPSSWSVKKRDLMRGKPHQQKPDDDNLAKALKDALMDSDQVVYCGAPLKLWADRGMVEIYELTITT